MIAAALLGDSVKTSSRGAGRVAERPIAPPQAEYLDTIGTPDRRLHAYRLSPGEADDVLDLALHCHGRYRRVDDPVFLEHLAWLAHSLPAGPRAAANAARLDDRKLGFSVTGNVIDDDRLGPTPPSWHAADTDASAPYAFMLALYGALFGEPIAWLAQQDGRLVTDIVPTAGMEASDVSSSSEKALGWHTEDAFSPYRADHVALLCLRTPQPVATTISWIDAGALPRAACDVLFEARFRTLPDPSHERRAGPRELPEPVAVLSGSADAPVLRIDRDYTIADPGDRAASAALGTLVDALDANLADLPLSAGTVGILDNRNVVHGRRPFRARFDGSDRWLKRVNLVEDLRRTRPGRRSAASRVIG